MRTQEFGTILSALYKLYHLTFTTTLGDSSYYYPQFTDRETETQRGQVALLGGKSLQMVEPGLKLRQFVSEECIFYITPL